MESLSNRRPRSNRPLSGRVVRVTPRRLFNCLGKAEGKFQVDEMTIDEFWTERRLPGYSRPPYPVTPWENFTPDPVWAGSDLRTRRIFGERCTQFKGVLMGELSEESPSLIGILEPGFRPAQTHGFVVGGRRRGEPNLAIWSDGTVLLLQPIAQSSVIHVVYPLD